MKRCWMAGLALLCMGVAWSAPVVATAAAAPVGVGGPMVRGEAAGVPTISLNWSGYAATSTSKFNYVHSVFVEPTITCNGMPNRWTSNWVGFDGFNSQTVEQDGTFAFCGGSTHTTPMYEAWYEMYPAASVNVFKVQAGDIIDATASYSGGKFTLTISDASRGKTATNVSTCATCQRTSAEWIVERPALCNNAETKCFLTALADFGTTTMTGDFASVNGGAAEPITAFTNYPIFMVNPIARGFITLDTVGAFTKAVDGFTATWDRSGGIVPIQL